jgi:hypothetical protein
MPDVSRVRGRVRRPRLVGRGGDGGRREFGDGGWVGEHGADGELAAASNANAKVNVERGTPVDVRARGVKLAFEDSVPMGERQHVRGNLLDSARRRQLRQRRLARGGAGRRRRPGHHASAPAIARREP